MYRETLYHFIVVGVCAVVVVVACQRFIIRMSFYVKNRNKSFISIYFSYSLIHWFSIGVPWHSGAPQAYSSCEHSKLFLSSRATKCVESLNSMDYLFIYYFLNRNVFLEKPINCFYTTP